MTDWQKVKKGSEWTNRHTGKKCIVLKDADHAYVNVSLQHESGRQTERKMHYFLDEYVLLPPRPETKPETNCLSAPYTQSASMSSDNRHIRHISADFGEGRPYDIIADVRYVPGASQDEMLSISKLLTSSPELRDVLRDLTKDIATYLDMSRPQAQQFDACLTVQARLSASLREAERLLHSLGPDPRVPKVTQEAPSV